MSRSGKLYDLQRIDSQLDKHQNRLKEIATILADDKKLALAERQANKTEVNLQQAQKELRSAEAKVQDQRFKIKQSETKLYSGNVKNPKELQALQEEVQALKRYLSIVEDRQLEAMLNVDEMSEKNDQAQAILQKTKAESANRNADLLAEKAKIDKNMAALGGKRLNCVGQIDKPDLAIYEDLRSKRAGVAIAKVNDRACTACGATLSAALNQVAYSFSHINHCETCGRILYGS